MPAIEHVHMRNVVDDDAALPTCPLTLLALKEMSINFNDSSSSRLFASLELPLTASVLVSFEGSRNQAVDPLPIFSLAARLYEGMGTPLDIRLGIEDDTIGIWCPSGVAVGGRKVTLPHYKDATNLFPLLNHLPIKRFTTVNIQVSSHIAAIERLLLQFIHLKHLEIWKYPNDSLFSMLLRADTHSPVPLPNLQTLRADFYLVKHIAVLERALGERHDLGLPLPTISAEKSKEKRISHLQDKFGVILYFT
ncbi:hypothetical protein ONZ45_g8542 [Pleurotus djamor]|nr:hypothetical protein ONZ45_g8542 [Pleurotus djamor]